jgi:2-polyprenyl-3-methyl-5-hydroxy-6-metoxy-1,4-benzoquinol methylase
MPHVPSLEEQAEFYDRRWARDAAEDRLNGFQLARAAAVFDALSFIDRQYAIRKIPEMRICDLGCGRGWMASQLQGLGCVTGVDLSPDGVKIAAERWPAIKFECADILKYDAGEKFDLIVSSEVIEHIADSKKPAFVDTVSRNLKSGGFVVITTPNSRAKSAWERAGQLSQLIEDWPSRRQLRALFRQDYELLLHKTFVHQYTYLGVHRFFSAPKLLRFLRRRGFIELYEGLQSSLGVGLHQVLIARRK